MNNKSKTAIISGVLGALYSIYLIAYFGGAMDSTNGAEMVGGAIASALVMPHMILVILGSIFMLIGAFINKAGFALTGAILFCVSAAAFIMYAPFVVPMIVLGFIGYSKIRKIKMMA
ncbi:hypothetical protein [uncultured Clostridium sp.]|uniref:hypothetical protein n=1 Tax=uncultured Clostridium sp. TaxID=59620 RepID=UPI00261958AA|nr:hypothetical protein [uncultured Clostridium sp.]